VVLVLRKIILSLFFASCVITASATDLSFTPANSAITGHVRYTVVGKYSARFERFSGTITLDEKTKAIQAVTLKIDATSVRSKFAKLDRIVRSPTLLDTKKFPTILFKSTSIKRTDAGYRVKGKLSMHGVTREVEFPFKADVDGTKHRIRANGEWPIVRKDFGVTWNAYLDHGGVVVGNTIVVDWNVIAE